MRAHCRAPFQLSDSRVITVVRVCLERLRLSRSRTSIHGTPLGRRNSQNLGRRRTEPSVRPRRGKRSPSAYIYPTLRQTWPRAVPEAAMCVRKISAQCVLQFTPSLAAGCVLHRPVSRVIHCSELSFGSDRISAREILIAFESFYKETPPGGGEPRMSQSSTERSVEGSSFRSILCPRCKPNRSTGSREPSRRRTPDIESEGEPL